MNNNGVCVSTKTAIIVGIIFAAMVVFGIISRNKNAAYAKEMNNYVENVVKPALAYSDSVDKLAQAYKAKSDSIGKINVVQEARIKKLTINVVILRGKNQDLTDIALADPLTTPAARAAITGLQKEVDFQRVIILNYKQLTDSQKIRIAYLDPAYELQKTRADSLKMILDSLPKPPGPIHVLGIKMPHIPKGIGYIAVAVGGYYVGTQVNK